MVRISNPWDCKVKKTNLCQLCQSYKVCDRNASYQGRDMKSVYAWNVKNTE